MQPEISRRCNSCGASTPEGSMFCPECGQPLGEGPGATDTHKVAEQKTPGESSAVASAAGSDASPAGEAQPSAPAPAQPPAQVETAGSDPKPEIKTEDQTVSSANPTRVERTREKLQHASSVARGAIEQNVKRADKIRHVSSAMLEEASYDPSLRFVLVALGVFIVFLLLLLLSKVMG